MKKSSESTTRKSKTTLVILLEAESSSRLKEGCFVPFLQFGPVTLITFLM